MQFVCPLIDVRQRAEQWNLVHDTCIFFLDCIEHPVKHVDELVEDCPPLEQLLLVVMFEWVAFLLEPRIKPRSDETSKSFLARFTNSRKPRRCHPDGYGENLHRGFCDLLVRRSDSGLFRGPSRHRERLPYE